MFAYGKTTQSALGALSLLAEVYGDDGATRLSAADIAERRGLQRPFVAKVLTALAAARMVTSSPGPHGGYALARPPEAISLYDVAEVFERVDRDTWCPLGGGHCGRESPCALHEQLAELRAFHEQFLRRTTLTAFRVHAAAATVTSPPA